MSSISTKLEIIPATRMDEVLKRALVREPTPIEWDEAAAAAKAAPPVTDAPEDDASGLTAH